MPGRFSSAWEGVDRAVWSSGPAGAPTVRASCSSRVESMLRLGRGGGVPGVGAVSMRYS